MSVDHPNIEPLSSNDIILTDGVISYWEREVALVLDLSSELGGTIAGHSGG